MSNSAMIRDFTTGNPMKQLITFSLPFLLSNILQQAYSMADTIIVGRYLGSVGLSAVSNASYINFLFMMFCFGVSSAGQIIISQHIGAKNRERLQNTIGTLLTLQAIMGILFVILPFFVGNALMKLMHVQPEALESAREYLYVCAVGNLAMSLYNAVSSIMRGMGDSKHPTYFVIIASVLNVILDIVFVGPMKMGCYGAALATTVSQYVACIASLWFAYRHKVDFCFDFKLKSFMIDKKETKILVTLGIPMMIQNTAITISMLFITARINTYGLVATAVTSVGNKITMAASICCGALNTAASTIVGQCFAAGKLDRITITLKNVLALGSVFAIIVSVCLIVFPEQIFGIFNSEAEVLAMCHSYILIGVIDTFGFVSRATAMSFINGIGFSSLASVGGLIDGVVLRFGLALLFEKVFHMGVRGLWLGGVLAGFTFLVIGSVYYASGKWKSRKSLVE